MKRIFIFGISTLISASLFSQNITEVGDKVGIGAGDPKEKLEVEGTGRFVTQKTGLNYLLKIGGKTPTVNNAVGIGFDPEGYNDWYLNRIKTAIVVEGDGSGWSRGNLHILQANNGEHIAATLSDAVFTIDRFGKVGINQKNPNAKLDIFSSYSNEINIGLKLFYEGTWGNS